MTFEPTLQEQTLHADTRRSAAARLSTRERLAELLAGAGFVLATAGLWAVSPPGHVMMPAALWSGLVMVLAMRVRFETPFGFTVATQLAFVPLLFAMPAALVPIASCLALVIACLPDVIAGRLAPGRLFRAPGNSWFALGPAWVFALAGVHLQAGAGILLAALCAQFVADFAVSSVALAIERGARLRAQLRETWVYAVDAALSGIGLVVAEQIHEAPYAVLAVVPLLWVLAMFARERQGRLGNLLELNATYRGTALLLGDVIAADDRYTGEHSEGVVSLALAVAEWLGLDTERRRNLEFGALLHDVGKIAIPKAIINKPGRLDPSEWAVIQTHTLEGERMLAHVGGFMLEVGAIVRSHHERWDGGGYPEGLSGAAIPLEARIITGCDSWNAMRTDRPYRRALAHETAVSEIVSGTGSQFDPEVARALLEIVGPVDPPAPSLVHPRIDEHVVQF
jgi:putative nucleotidyltransferase with HDIG domain